MQETEDIVTRLERLTGYLQFLLSQCEDGLMRHVPEMRAQAESIRDHIATIATLRAEVEGLRADAERYRWLIETMGDHCHGMPGIEAAWDDDIDDWRSAKFFGLKDRETINAAIDAAKAGKEGA